MSSSSCADRDEASDLMLLTLEMAELSPETVAAPMTLNLLALTLAPWHVAQ